MSENYGAYKVSDRTHQNYRVSETDAPARQESMTDLERKL